MSTSNGHTATNKTSSWQGDADLQQEIARLLGVRPLSSTDMQLQVQHVQQKESWDCGLTCIKMIADYVGHPLCGARNGLADYVGTQSIWTVDLLFLFKDYVKETGRVVILSTEMPGASTHYSKVDFYANHFDLDQPRVDQLFDTAHEHGFKIYQGTLTWQQLRDLLLTGRFFIVTLIDLQRILKHQNGASPLVADVCNGAAHDEHYEHATHASPPPPTPTTHTPSAKQSSTTSKSGATASVWPTSWSLSSTSPPLQDRPARAPPDATSGAALRPPASSASAATPSRVTDTRTGASGTPVGGDRGGGGDGGSAGHRACNGSAGVEKQTTGTNGTLHTCGGHNGSSSSTAVCVSRAATATSLCGGPVDAPSPSVASSSSAAKSSCTIHATTAAHDTPEPASPHKAYCGHFILLTGFQSDPPMFVYHDPALDKAPSLMSPEELDFARKSYGTDEDLLIIEVAAPPT